MADQSRRDEFAQEQGYDTYYEYRNAQAQEAGWDSYSAQRAGMRDAREAMDEMGVDWDLAERTDYAEFVRDFDEGVYDRDALRDIFDAYFPDGSDDEFYDWLTLMYEEMAG
jgi:hypothetical protein